MKLKGMKRILSAFVIAIALMLMGTATAHAIPTLQLYIEGAVYDPSDQSWVISSNSFTLWVLGNVGADGTIYDVKLSAAYDTAEMGGGSSISISPTTATSGLLPAPEDTSTPSVPVADSSGTGDTPLFGDGSSLPSHGVFGAGVSWESWALGDMTLTDSPIGDFTQGGCPLDPTCTYPSTGQINAYDIVISGYSSVHFDTYDHIAGAQHFKYRKAPFSHDAELVPEPSTLLLLGSGLIGLGIIRKRFGRA